MPNLPYPHNIIEFTQQFSTEEACEKYLYASRWPKGFICPVCEDRDFYYHKARRLFRCKANDHQTSLTAGTIMHRSKVPLHLWFWAAYLLTSETPGMSALQLKRQLGINRYETVFNLLHKLRASMVNPFRDKIGPANKIEVDETYIGGPTTGGKRGRGTKKAIVIIAVERQGKKAGRVRLRHIKDVKAPSIIKFIEDSVNKKSVIVSDAFKSYGNLKQHGYKHQPVTQTLSASGAPLPIAHLVISNLKTWLKGTFHGVSSKHLQAYLNEYTFRFNRRFYPMAGFRTILNLSSHLEDRPTYKGLYKGEWVHPNPKERGVI